MSNEDRLFKEMAEDPGIAQAALEHHEACGDEHICVSCRLMAAIDVLADLGEDIDHTENCDSDECGAFSSYDLVDSVCGSFHEAMALISMSGKAIRALAALIDAASRQIYDNTEVEEG